MEQIVTVRAKSSFTINENFQIQLFTVAIYSDKCFKCTILQQLYKQNKS